MAEKRNPPGNLFGVFFRKGYKMDIKLSFCSKKPSGFGRIVIEIPGNDEDYINVSRAWFGGDKAPID